jgi:predicted CoA-binding protein
MATVAEIDAFLEGRRVVMIGVSVCPNDVTRAALRELVDRGHDIVPVRQGVKELDGVRAYGSVAEVPHTVDAAMIFTPPQRAERAVFECLERNILRFWLDPGGLRGTSPDAIELCERSALALLVGGPWHRPRLARGTAPPADETRKGWHWPHLNLSRA